MKKMLRTSIIVLMVLMLLAGCEGSEKKEYEQGKYLCYFREVENIGAYLSDSASNFDLFEHKTIYRENMEDFEYSIFGKTYICKYNNTTLMPNQGRQYDNYKCFLPDDSGNDNYDCVARIGFVDGRLTGFSLLKSDTNESDTNETELIGEEERDNLARNIFEQYVTDPTKYQMTKTEGSYMFTRMEQGYKTIDTMAISVDAYGTVCSFFDSFLGIMDKWSTEDIDENEIIKSIEYRLNEELKDIDYEITDYGLDSLRLLLFEEGKPYAETKVGVIIKDGDNNNYTNENGKIYFLTTIQLG